MLTGLFAFTLITSLGCVDDEVESVELDDTEVRASPSSPSLLPQLPPAEPPPPPPPQPPSSKPTPAKVCKSSCEVCVELHKRAYECMAYDKEFDADPPPIDTFDCIVCDNDGAASAAHTCETQAKIHGIYFTDMEAERLSCSGPNEPLPVKLPAN
jgi:hypothetical protein